MASGTVAFPVVLYIPLTAEAEIRPVDHTGLFRYRFAFQTVGQGYRLWPKYAQPILPDEPQPLPPDAQSLFRFRNVAPPQTPPHPPYWFWPRFVGSADIEPMPVQPDNTQLHRFRTAFQTVGQSVWLLSRTTPTIPEPEQIIVQPDNRVLFSIRNPARTSPAQPFWINPRFVGSADPETPPVLLDQQQLFRYRAPHVTAAKNPPYWWLSMRFIPAPEPEPMPRPVDQQLYFSMRPSPPVIPSLRVQAVYDGEYGGQFYEAGDVFDIVGSAFSDNSVNYGPDSATIQLGWMVKVPASTPLYQARTQGLTSIGTWLPPNDGGRRTVF